jgi:organic hydroperoxide reductase OsmC/OhrA
MTSPAASSQPAQEGSGFEVRLNLEEGYRFSVDFEPPIASLEVDEYPPIGAGHGPNPSRLLATAIGHCLASSFLFCVRKARIEVPALTVEVSGRTVRNERGRWRVAGLRARLIPQVNQADRERLGRCLEIFEDFCVVTQSVRQGLPVAVEVATQP